MVALEALHGEFQSSISPSGPPLESDLSRQFAPTRTLSTNARTVQGRNSARLVWDRRRLDQS